MKKIIGLTTILVVLYCYGCGSTTSIEVMSQWIGKSEKDVKSSWGKHPDSLFSDGPHKIVMVYRQACEIPGKKGGTAQETGTKRDLYTPPSPPLDFVVKTTFILTNAGNDDDNKVTSWKVEYTPKPAK